MSSGSKVSEDPVKLHKTGTSLYDSGKYKDAIEKFMEASRLYEKVKNFFDASYTLFKAAECSFLLKDYATPIFNAAGIAKGSITIALIDDRSFNAFVTTGRRMFVNIGALMESKSPNEIIGVIAHESGHIAGDSRVFLQKHFGIYSNKFVELTASGLQIK